MGNHPYSVGSYSVVVTIGNHSGGNTAVALSSATVADAPLSSQVLQLLQPSAGT